MPVTTPETRADVAYTMRDRRFSMVALLITGLVALIVGFLAGQGLEKNNADVIPGGAPTDNAPGPSPSDTK